MKILWNSSTPIGISGYGICTRELTRRAHEDGHFIRIATKHGYFGWHEWEKGIDVFDGNLNHLNRMLEYEKFDYVFSHWDIWVLNKKKPIFRFPKEKWVAYIPIDTEKISTALIDVSKDVGIPVALSKHGKRELEGAGIKNVLYAPHGVDTKAFCPNEKGRQAERKFYKWDNDTFVIGSVGLNYPDDRKGFIQLMRAFKMFHDDHPKSRLYLHTHAPGLNPNTINLSEIAVNLGIEKLISFPDQLGYDLNHIDEEWLSDTYNSFDVFCLPTLGEGFGLPLIEAQACGVPVITTDTTTGPELAGDTGWLIPQHEDDLHYMPTGTWRAHIRPSEILKCLELAHSAWKYGGYGKIKENAREFALQYEWDVIWKKYWQPIFKLMEAKLIKRKKRKKKNG